jgi:hypothetical protein
MEALSQRLVHLAQSVAQMASLTMQAHSNAPTPATAQAAFDANVLVAMTSKVAAKHMHDEANMLAQGGERRYSTNTGLASPTQCSSTSPPPTRNRVHLPLPHPPLPLQGRLRRRC